MSDKLTSVPGVFTMANKFAGGLQNGRGSSSNKKKINKHYLFIYLFILLIYLFIYY